MKKIVALILSLIMLTGMLSGCGIVIDGESGSKSGEMSEKGTVGLSVSTQNNPFFVALAEGAKEAAQKAGVKLTIVDAGDDATKQVSDIEDLVSKKGQCTDRQSS